MKIERSTLPTLDPAQLPQCLKALTPHQKAIVNDALANAEASSDDELRSHFVSEFSLTQEQAAAVVGFRDRFFAEPFFMLFPETLA